MNDSGYLLVIQDVEDMLFCTKGREFGVTGLCCVLFVTANKQFTTRSPYVCVMNFSDVEERTCVLVCIESKCVLFVGM